LLAGNVAARAFLFWPGRGWVVAVGGKKAGMKPPPLTKKCAEGEWSQPIPRDRKIASYNQK
jgi:hypothetical protein